MCPPISSQNILVLDIAPCYNILNVFRYSWFIVPCAMLFFPDKGFKERKELLI